VTAAAARPDGAADVPALAASDAAAGPGRNCPLHYRYAPRDFAREAEAICETLYVVGGLYGNEVALESVLALFEREIGAKRLVFNGDFHWFDVDPASFERVDRCVLGFDALRGNVETELAAPDGDAGCGCAYPDWVDEAVVERSNRILRRLRDAATPHPQLTRRLAALPVWRRIDVGGLRVAIVHGDAESLAGWGFAQEHLRDPAHRGRVRRWFEAAQVDAFACTHTCLPIFHSLPTAGRALAPMVLNNGSAGMPNFRGDGAGLLTRISLRRFGGAERRFGLAHGGVHVDAIAVAIDAHRWTRRFLLQWPPGSDAHASYWQRITDGPAYHPHQALAASTDD
jgi:hypothetical protein